MALPMSLRTCFLAAAVAASMAAALMSGLSTAAAQTGSAVDKKKQIHDSFDHDKLNTDIWCPCQIKNEASPIRFPKKADGDRFLRIMADEASLGGNTCDYEIKTECTFPKFDPNALADRDTGLMKFALPADLAVAIELTKEELKAEAEAEVAIPEGLGTSLIQKLREDSIGPAFPADLSFEGLKQELNTISPLYAPEGIAPESLMRRRLASPTHQACEEKDDTRFYCDRAAHGRADQSGEENTCIQRQEIRIRSGKRRAHAVKDPMWYSIRFRMPSSIEDTCNSVRWITAQWKHNNAALKNRRMPQNPMLAQRFDDGVLHVTVQDAACRCIVASARDPRLKKQPEWKSGSASSKMCSSNDMPDGCKANFSLDYGADPVLANPLGEWTTMSYFLKPDRDGKGEIQIWQEDRRIVTVTGDIGYEIDEQDGKKGHENKIKFKFGHYRDYMPFHHEMDVEFVRIDFDPPADIKAQLER